MNVAQLTHDHLEKRKGNLEFSWEGYYRFWGGQNFGDDSDIVPEAELEAAPKVNFRLYDDDDELYYSGWLKNDDGCTVQQFVLAWAMADSGCTRIDVKKGDKWLTEIS